jgi:hypothetical protein
MEVVSVVLIQATLTLSLPTSPAVAGWIPTRDAAEGHKARLVSIIDREQISLAFQELGIDPAEAKRRVNGLTQAEARLAIERLDRLPAGGSAVGAIVGGAVLVFLVLLITDLLGYTDVFPFVKRTVK